MAAFSLRRQGVLHQRSAGLVAGLGALGLVTGGVLTMIDVLSAWPQPGGVPVVAIGGGLAAGMSLADIRQLDDGHVVTVLRGLAQAFVVAAGAFLVANLVGVFVASLALGTFGLSGLGPRYVAITIGVTIGFLGTGALIYRITNRSRSTLDLRWPTLRELGVVVVGFVVLQTLLVGINQIVVTFDIPFAPSQVQRQAEEIANPSFVLVLIPLSWLAIAPGEEFVYRNIVQRDLYETVGRLQAVIATSGIFASIHIFQYASQQAAATLVSLTVVFVLSLVLGLVYERTNNLVVPILLHGTFNAVSFWQIYVTVTA